MKRIDLTNNVFDRLTVLSFSHTHTTPNGSKKAIWLCRCACGNEVLVASQALINKTTRSCGCLQRELTSKRARTHHLTRSKTYHTWRGMKERCYSKNNNHFHFYGARGIYVCDRWLNNFEAFVEDMGVRPEGTTLDRIDNNGPYSPENCRWASAAAQARNRSDNVWICWQNQRKILSDWAQILGITPRALAVRIKRWGLTKAMAMKINAGVATVVCGSGTTSMPQEEFDVAITMFEEAGVRVVKA